jgi:phosphatidylglycerol---prolipoprotein diacylglyceryl transferase
MTFALAYPAIDPIIVEIGPFAIRWYALAYIAGLVIGWRLVRRAVEWPPKTTSKEAVDDFLLWATLGVVLGGRIGYVLFYQPGYFLENPAAIVQVWRGGMAFHGGFLGVVVAGLLLCRKRSIDPWRFGDAIAAATPVGLFFGRIANFINGELWGRTAPDVPWAMVFPGAGDVPRHPSQLYEAALEGVLLFVVVQIVARSAWGRARPGAVIGVFIAGYGAARFVVEFFRQPDAHLGYLTFGMTMGQWLSLPMALAGVALVVWRARAAARSRQ